MPTDRSPSNPRDARRDATTAQSVDAARERLLSELSPLPVAQRVEALRAEYLTRMTSQFGEEARPAFERHIRPLLSGDAAEELRALSLLVAIHRAVPLDAVTGSERDWRIPQN